MSENLITNEKIKFEWKWNSNFNLRLNIWGKLWMFLKISRWIGFNGGGFVIFRLKVHERVNYVYH
jgi:hypothetical protein